MSPMGLFLLSSIVGALLFLAAGFSLARWLAVRTTDQPSPTVHAANEVPNLKALLTNVQAEKATLGAQLVAAQKTHHYESNQIEMLEAKLHGFEALRSEYLRLREQHDAVKQPSGEPDQRSEGTRPIQPSLARKAASARPGPRRTETSLEGTLSLAISTLLDESTSAVSIVDHTGLPLTTAGFFDDALGAFTTILAEPCVRVNSFIPFGRPRLLTLVDDDGARVSIWPFAVGKQTMTLVALSTRELPADQVKLAISKVVERLSRPRRDPFRIGRAKALAGGEPTHGHGLKPGVGIDS